MDYKELVERMKKGCEDCEYRAECQNDDARECTHRLRAATAITELLARAERAERERDAAIKELEAARVALGELSGVANMSVKTLYGLPLSRIYQMAMADKRGKVFILPNIGSSSLRNLTPQEQERAERIEYEIKRCCCNYSEEK